MNIWRTIKRPPWRTIFPGCCLLLGIWLGYWLWAPGLDVRDGRDDRGRNGIWLGHGWLGGDDWFIRNGKTNEIARFRDSVRIRELAEKLRRHHISNVFPHLCPVKPNGRLPSVNAEQVERFLDAFEGVRVMPWIGGPNGRNVRLGNAQWRAAFTTNVRSLLSAHPRLAGVQINVEPLASGDGHFLQLLEELRKALPKEKLLSVAAYPPPTWWHPYENVHWEKSYFREVARRSDQLAVMMYDAALRIPKAYQRLMANWTQEVLDWSEGKAVLLGLPTYDDAGVGYHDPRVENLTNALLGIHRGLSRQPLPANYQGVAIYCEWETSDAEWQHFREHFLSQNYHAK
jgi:Glycosyl hydrolases family 18